MTTIDDGIAALLAEPQEQTVRAQLLDRLEEDGADAGAAALALVLRFRESDGPRLLYADVCERDGQGERAEFVRVQCELAKIPDEPPVCRPILRHGRPEPSHGAFCPWCQWVDNSRDRRDELRRRERDLWDVSTAEQWFDVGFPPGAPYWESNFPNRIAWRSGERECRLTVCRGFVQLVEIAAADWLRCGDAITAAHPVERLRLTTWPTGRDGINVEDVWDAEIAGKRVAVEPPPGADHHLTIEWQNRGLRSREYTVALFAARWPGLAVELPRAGEPEIEVINLPAGESSFENAVNQMREDIFAAVMGAYSPGGAPPDAG